MPARRGAETQGIFPIDRLAARVLMVFIGHVWGRSLGDVLVFISFGWMEDIDLEHRALEDTNSEDSNDLEICEDTELRMADRTH